VTTPVMTSFIPSTLKPGPEARALERFHRDMTCTGAIEGSGMGPGSPRMLATGRGGTSDLAATGLNPMNRKRPHFVFETAVRTVAKQLRSAQRGERLESPTVQAGSIR
jgi:hypothetical protein